MPGGRANAFVVECGMVDGDSYQAKGERGARSSKTSVAWEVSVSAKEHRIPMSVPLCAIVGSDPTQKHGLLFV